MQEKYSGEDRSGVRRSDYEAWKGRGIDLGGKYDKGNGRGKVQVAVKS